MTEQPGFEYNEPETITYYSEITGRERHANILLPVDYYDTSEKYPVLYLLHGLDGSHRTWKNKYGHIIIQNLSYLYDVPEMIVVFPNSAVNEQEDTDDLDIYEKVAAYDLTEQDLVTSLMPFISSHYFVKEKWKYKCEHNAEALLSLWKEDSEEICLTPLDLKRKNVCAEISADRQSLWQERTICGFPPRKKRQENHFLQKKILLCWSLFREKPTDMSEKCSSG